MPENEEPKYADNSKKEFTTKHILIIDDSKTLRKALSNFILKKFHCDVLEAENGRDAMNIIRKENGYFNLILCDLMMPVMDGFTFIKTIKQHKKFKLIPIICITVKSDKSTVLRSIQLGAIDFISKPYDLDSVATKISKFIDIK
ncbi:MAG: hypothetical protein COA79_22545 [Planctomycetota bacterium]|nr:response regulator [Bacteroidia bacterium]PCJ53793.1 MAG: hypothetical protein COA79_22545 [Planctomycetota bacterium]